MLYALMKSKYVNIFTLLLYEDELPIGHLERATMRESIMLPQPQTARQTTVFTSVFAASLCSTTL
ncbi:hypothetical protein GCM10010869_21590 [Mesorhizobium tianshanense]|nr:hypothetical protein GCM10010869_21590 [Mesorhizobium tianshanense]